MVPARSDGEESAEQRKVNKRASDKAPIEQLKAIAHPLRFQILETLKVGELNVGEIENASGIGQPALSQQLGVLRKAGLVETRKDAKLVFYRRDEESLTGLADLICTAGTTGRTAQAARPSPAPGAANFARMS